MTDLATRTFNRLQRRSKVKAIHFVMEHLWDSLHGVRVRVGYRIVGYRAGDAVVRAPIVGRVRDRVDVRVWARVERPVMEWIDA
jgi:hypothetical protein